MTPTLNLDFSGVQEYDVLESGNYPVMIETVTMRQSKSDPNAYYLNWDLSITEGDAEGRHLFFMTSLKEKALWRLKTVFESLGIYQEQMALEVDEETGVVYGPELAGLVGLAVVSQEVYEKRLQNKVDDLLPIQPEIQAPPPPPQAPRPPVPVRPSATTTPAPVKPSTPPAPVRPAPPKPATGGAPKKLNVQ